jgi:hypothetical protein
MIKKEYKGKKKWNYCITMLNMNKLENLLKTYNFLQLFFGHTKKTIEANRKLFKFN